MFVFPSLYEGFGMPPLEAMACGAPVVCSNASSLPEVVGDAALLVDPTDVDAMATVMMRVSEDANLREDLRRRGALRAKAYSWEQSARDLLRVYQDVVREESA
jgi:glycosyltransferase involved in cell wall biosynthesis